MKLKIVDSLLQPYRSFNLKETYVIENHKSTMDLLTNKPNGFKCNMLQKLDIKA